MDLNIDPDEGGSGNDTQNNEIEVMDVKAHEDNLGSSESGLHAGQDNGDVEAPIMEEDDVVIINEVELVTLSDTDSSSQGGSDVEFLPPSPRRVVSGSGHDHAQDQEGSSDDTDDGGRRRPKRCRKRSVGNRGPFFKQTFVSIQRLSILKNEYLIEDFNHYWICEECGEFFFEKENLRFHLNTHFKRYYCKLCNEARSYFESVTLTEFRRHIRESQCHREHRTQTKAYNRRNVPGLTDAEVALKMDKNNFLTVEQLRNGNPEKYEELKNVPIITLEELFGNRVTKTEPIEVDDADDDDVAGPCEVETTPTTRVKPTASLQIPRIREKRQAAIIARRKISNWVRFEEHDSTVEHLSRPASRRRRSRRKRKTSMEVDASQFDEHEEEGAPEVPEAPALGPSFAVAGPSRQVNQAETERQICEWSRPQEVSLTFTPENVNDCEEKSGSNDNATIEGQSVEDGGDASLEGAPLITDQEEGEGQGSSGTGRISHPLPASPISTVREAVTPLAEDSKEKLKKKKKKVKGKEDSFDVAGPSRQVNQNENQFDQRSQQPEEVSLTLTLENAKDSGEKFESNDINAVIEENSVEDEGHASSEDALLITNQDEDKDQSSSRNEAISHSLPASTISTVREAATPLAEDSKETLKKKKKKVKAKEGKNRQIPLRRESLPRSWKPKSI